ncbi:MAG: hypothetical protein JWN56_1002 [Sphingobacteriales bacterium]|nr:hypothetical protein [Sphingobacteriales bacterium]
MINYKKMKYCSMILFFLLLLTVDTVHSQKLPSIQSSSIHAPNAIKMDGKASEWNNKFQAYNKKTNIFYTISNDDQMLYLTMQATNPGVITKMVVGGVTFTIDISNQKKDQNNFAVTFPDYDEHATPLYLDLHNFPDITNNLAKNRMQADSLRIILNKKLTDNLKTIAILGSSLISDSVISIYNAEGIKAVSLFDDSLRYTYELAIPLKYLGSNLEKSKVFNYSIRLNGSANNAKIELLPGGRGLVYTAKNGVSYRLPSTPESMDMVYPTDFSGAYTLAN